MGGMCISGYSHGDNRSEAVKQIDKISQDLESFSLEALFSLSEVTPSILK